MSKRLSLWIENHWGTSLLLAVALTLFLLFPEWGTLPRGDEALCMLQSRWISLGELPYGDFFQFIWPGILFLGAIFIKLFGFTVIGLRILTVLMMLSAVWVIDNLAKRYLSHAARFYLICLLIVCVLNHNSFFSHHALSTVSAVWAVFFLIRFSEKETPVTLTLSGLFSGIAILTTQSLGLLVSLALAGTLVMMKKPVARYAVGCLLPLLGLAMYLGANNLFPAFWQDGVLWLLEGHYNDTTLLGYFAAGPLKIRQIGFSPQQVPTIISILTMAWLPVLGTLWGWQMVLTHHDRRESPYWKTLLILTAASTAMLLSTWSYSTSYHIALNSWPGLLLLAMFLNKQLQKTPWVKYLAGGLGLVFLFSAANVAKAQYNILNHAQWFSSYGTFEKSLYLPLPSQQVYNYALLNELVHQHSKDTDPIFVMNASPEFYILSGRPHTSRFLLVYPVLLSASQEGEIVSDLARKKPRMIIDDGKAALIVRFDPRFQKHQENLPRLNKLESYIQKNYRPMNVGGQFTLYVRTSS